MSNYPTRKSFKSLLRDKPRHSGKLTAHTLSPRKGGAGRGNVGRPGDELNQPALSHRDPNWSPEDEDEDEALYLLPSSSHLLPSSSTSTSFSASIADYAQFKKAVKAAAKEYLSSLDPLEFSSAISELQLPLFHQDIPYIVIKYAFDLSDENRHTLSNLLSHLFRATPALITPQHISHSITKLAYALPDLLLDVPNARTFVKEFATFFVAGGMLDPKVWEACEQHDEMVGEQDKVKVLKGKIERIVNDLLQTEEIDDALQSIQELACPALHYEVIKALLRSSFDRTNRQRELASRFLSFTSTSLFSSDSIEQAFSTLLQRVEDLYLDVPDILHLLSVFIARAVVDECLQPSFLSRVDLDARDLGAQVLQQAERLLQGEGRVERMEKCWQGQKEGRRGSQVGAMRGKGVEERKEGLVDARDDVEEIKQ